MNLRFIEEGHYSDGNNTYMSIWTYKRNNGLPSSNQQNYEDAKEMPCSDKHWMPFNESDIFKKGWVYNIDCLDSFYKKK